MAGENKLMQLAQYAGGGSPYDEDAYMRMPVARRGGPPQQQQQYDGGGSDMDMMMIYGPEDQVAFDQQGRPIPLADPRHPRNQRSAPQINAVPRIPFKYEGIERTPYADMNVSDRTLTYLLQQRYGSQPSPPITNYESENLPHLNSGPDYEMYGTNPKRNPGMMRLGGPEPDAIIGRGNMAYNPRARAMGYGESPANTFLNDRLYERYMGGVDPSPYGGGGTDYELEMRYGPNGIPQEPLQPEPYNSYPQRRR